MSSPSAAPAAESVVRRVRRGVHAVTITATPGGSSNYRSAPATAALACRCTYVDEVAGDDLEDAAELGVTVAERHAGVRRPAALSARGLGIVK